MLSNALNFEKLLRDYVLKYQKHTCSKWCNGSDHLAFNNNDN